LSQAMTSDFSSWPAGLGNFKNLELTQPSYNNLRLMSGGLAEGRGSQLCSCGARFVDDSAFCFKCGAKKRETKLDEVRGLSFEEKCVCGNVFLADSMFCWKCGKR